MRPVPMRCPHETSPYELSPCAISTCDLSLWKQTNAPSPYDSVSKFKSVSNLCTHVIIGYPEPTSTIVHKFEKHFNHWNRDQCYFSTLRHWTYGTFAWESTKPTSFVLRPASLLRPKSYDHPTSYIHNMSYANMSYANMFSANLSILCASLIWPSYTPSYFHRLSYANMSILCLTQICPNMS
jgi:hypothetical protein